MHEIRFLPDAEQDLHLAAEWYAERSPDLATNFLGALDTVLKQISTFPLAAPTIYKDLRQAVLRRFPYRLIYQPADSFIVVFALLHQSREHMRILRQRRPEP